MNEKVLKYDAVLSNFIQEFDSRFEGFRHNAADFDLFVQPFTMFSADLQMELIELQCDSELKIKFMSLPLTDFYKCVPAIRSQMMLSFSLMNLTGKQTNRHSCTLYPDFVSKSAAAQFGKTFEK